MVPENLISTKKKKIPQQIITYSWLHSLYQQPSDRNQQENIIYSSGLSHCYPSVISILNFFRKEWTDVQQIIARLISC